ncbi:hypothetical protein OEZ86_004512 [Tetradesmus obliquus]|nr:hypothetical protein OEZ86_004512 [Tetradesmus obliquus]
MRQRNLAARMARGAPVYMAAVLEYLAGEVMELAGQAAAEVGRRRITPRHLQLAIRGDAELSRLLQHTVISQGGVLPHIEPALLPATRRQQQQQHGAAGASDSE